MARKRDGKGSSSDATREGAPGGGGGKSAEDEIRAAIEALRERGGFRPALTNEVAVIDWHPKIDFDLLQETGGVALSALAAIQLGGAVRRYVHNHYGTRSRRHAKGSRSRVRSEVRSLQRQIAKLQQSLARLDAAREWDAPELLSKMHEGASECRHTLPAEREFSRAFGEAVDAAAVASGRADLATPREPGFDRVRREASETAARLEAAVGQALTDTARRGVTGADWPLTVFLQDVARVYMAAGGSVATLGAPGRKGQHGPFVRFAAKLLETVPPGASVKPAAIAARVRAIIKAKPDAGVLRRAGIDPRAAGNWQKQEKALAEAARKQLQPISDEEFDAILDGSGNPK